jgi:hypothetical protein
MGETVYIYGLHEEGSEEIRYVGQTKHPRERLNNHISGGEGIDSNPKRQWLTDCISRNAQVHMEILETCASDIAVEREQHWIDYYGEKGHALTNKAKASPARAWRKRCADVSTSRDGATTTIKVGGGARKYLRIISALTDESIIDIMDRLTKAELAKVETQRVTQEAVARTGERAEGEGRSNH